MRNQRKLRQQPGESLEQWLRRRAANPAHGIPIDPRMTLDLYDRIALLEARVRELEPPTNDPTGERPLSSSD
ncbi:hypothetical protein [Arthrobacter sp. AZCC_0090]|uniref:hypothetical protein n=1 Tax=Arthrobacter sp. AZCC_0090 TaxID=2735881 RepID=UPI00160AB967|nr:hypothetical protein [Arthrobacter sp. AZCC_0090]MBB6405923.1 hypothetical protein [Arthrobacter sp. AZCC_0090]